MTHEELLKLQDELGLYKTNFYEELLAKIKPALHRPEFCANCACGKEFDEMYKLNMHIEEANNAYIFALNSIVKLHKPETVIFDGRALFVCENDSTPYPCFTIQAIERELK